MSRNMSAIKPGENIFVALRKKMANKSRREKKACTGLDSAMIKVRVPFRLMIFLGFSLTTA